MATLQSNAPSVKRVAANPGLELLQRLGYVVRGLLYGVVGVLALRLALAQPGGAAVDLSGGLVFLVSNPYGRFILLVSIVGLAAYSSWGLIRAIFDPLHRGSDPSGLMQRLGFLSSAISYAALVLFGLKLLTGAAATSTDSTKTTISGLFNHPGGGTLTLIAGLVFLGMGVGQLVEAYRAAFARDLKGAEMSAGTRKIVIVLGRYGMAARGIIFLVIGWFIVQAGLHHDPSKVQGFGGAFVFLGAQPFGHLVLGLVALGFVALGLHSLACARWVRLMGSSGSA